MVVPAGGCRLWGQHAVQSPALPVDPLQLAAEAENRVLIDTRMLQVLSRWGACMTGRGFRYTSPVTAQSFTPRGDSWPAEPSKAEIAIATADARCRQQVNVEGMWLALMTAYESQITSQHRAELIQARRITSKWLQNAAAYRAQAQKRPG